MVEIEVSCPSCKNSLDLSATANVSSKSLEATSTSGTLFVRVFNGNGEPIGYRIMPDDDYASIAGNLEVVPDEYCTHEIVDKKKRRLFLY